MEQGVLEYERVREKKKQLLIKIQGNCSEPPALT